MIRWSCVFSIVLVAVVGCASEDAVAPEATADPTQLLANTGAEDGNQDPFSWLPSAGWDGPLGPGNDARAVWSDQEAASGSRSLKLEVAAIVDENYYVEWTQALIADIPTDKPLRLSAKIKTSVAGDGVALVVRGDASNFPVMAMSTQNNIEITGDTEWGTVVLDVGVVPTNVDRLNVFLRMLSGTSGSAFFDDITLRAVEE